jgi:hypothetical protein
VALEIWRGFMPDGTKAEYRYHQSDAEVWASRKIGDFLDIRKNVKRWLTRKQVEALFARRRYNSAL